MGFKFLSWLRAFFGTTKDNHDIKIEQNDKTPVLDKHEAKKPFMPWSDLTPERETELIEGLAKRVVDYNLEFPSVLGLEAFRPISFIASRLGLNLIAPFLEFVGISGYEYTILFENEENIKRLIKRIEELGK
jgi:hypothetical protein